jgi:hypothetical protein
MKKWKTERVKDRGLLEDLLNSLELGDYTIHSVTMDQANGEYVVIYWSEETQTLNE